MKLDLGSFTFGSTIISGGNTPSWGTSLGQRKPDLKLTYPGYDNIIIGMMYKSIPVDKVYIPLGKGGHICNSLEDEGIQLAAMFDKVYINEVRVNASFIMLIYQDSSDSWAGRKTLKYNTKIEYRQSSTNIISNQNFVCAATEALQIEEDACWVVSDLFIVNQDELHMLAGIVNPNKSETYPSAEVRKKAFLEAIQNTYDCNPHIIEKYSSEYLRSNYNCLDKPLQQIFYGAPGTGKSYSVDNVCKQYRHHRTTFHPDSDYSTFVGCYKPSKEKNSLLNMKNVTDATIIEKLKEYKADKSLGIVGGLQKCTIEFAEYLLNCTNSKYREILAAADLSDAYEVEISKYLKLYKNLIKPNLRSSSAITYSFVPQVFTNAYIEAWQNPTEPVFLVVEEINRGNCAQIFGDLFQLLDRDDETGMSAYEISPDADLKNYIAKQGLEVSGVLDSNKEDISDKIASGELMKLPSNLYIWATMNTSDQSLFPIDSAFKRRWDWKYVPIDPESKTGWYVMANGERYSWSSFLEKINDVIATTTSSEDKQLGFYFCKAKTNEISAEKFVSKVLFYLYNDVFKDYDFEAAFFKHKDGEKKDKVINFREFFNVKENKINETVVAEILGNLGVEKLAPADEGNEA